MNYGEKAMPIGEWRNPWLIQRLKKPYGDDRDLVTHIFAFGCGYRDGGFSKEAMDILQEIFTFDYMGSAEYEFGEVPRTLQSMGLSLSDLSTRSFEIDMGDVNFDKWEERHFKKPIKGIKKIIYLLGKTDHHEAAEKYIRLLGCAEEPPRLKETSMFRQALLEPKDQKEDWRQNTQGWLDLTNKLFFFTSKDMFEKTCALILGSKQESKSA